MTLPLEDKTPAGYMLPQNSANEIFKKLFRRFFYPVYTYFFDKLLARKYGFKKSLECDKILRNQRGNDFETHRRRVNGFLPIQGKDLLIIGCGTGNDLKSWAEFGPKTITAIDYFRYDKAWELLKESFVKDFNVEVNFMQCDLTQIDSFSADQFDIVGSDAVFEHLNKFDVVLRQLYRVIKNEGVLYATFGPLWHTLGGDHISGNDGIKNGYNHLLLDKTMYSAYLKSLGEHSHNEHDGRTWIYNNMFSFLKPIDYITKIKSANFIKEYLSIIISQRTLQFQKQFPALFSQLETKHGFENLCIESMSIIFRKHEN